MTREEQEIIEKMNQMDMERGLHVMQQVLKHYSAEYNAERRQHAPGFVWEDVFVIIKVDRNMDVQRGPNAPHFDVLAFPDKATYDEFRPGSQHQPEAVDLADSGYCVNCELTMRGSKYSFCPICRGSLFLT